MLRIHLLQSIVENINIITYLNYIMSIQIYFSIILSYFLYYLISLNCIQYLLILICSCSFFIGGQHGLISFCYFLLVPLTAYSFWSWMIIFKLSRFRLHFRLLLLIYLLLLIFVFHLGLHWRVSLLYLLCYGCGIYLEDLRLGFFLDLEVGIAIDDCQLGNFKLINFTLSFNINFFLNLLNCFFQTSFNSLKIFLFIFPISFNLILRVEHWINIIIYLLNLWRVIEFYLCKFGLYRVNFGRLVILD